MIKDQAARLREISKLKRNDRESLRPVRRIAVTSGKGGVGKSNFSLNLGICLQMLGRRTLLIDANTNLSNIDVLLGINPQYTLADVILGDRFLPDVLLDGPEGLKILLTGSGVVEMVGLDSVVRERLEQGFSELEQQQDLILLDTGAGIADVVVELACSADEVIIITVPEPTAISDAYAAIKVISSRDPAVKFYLVVNCARNSAEAQEVARNLTLVVENYLSLKIESLGFIPRDARIPQAVGRQIPFLLANPHSPAAQNLMMIARRLLKMAPEQSNRKSLLHYLWRC